MKKQLACGFATLMLGMTALTAESIAAGNNRTDTPNTSMTSGANNAKADWNTEDTYWKENYSSRSYYKKGDDYTSYQPAYRYGVESYNRYSGKNYDQLSESELRQDWETKYGTDSDMSWDQAKGAVKDSYSRLYSNTGTTTTGMNSTTNNTGTVTGSGTATSTTAR